MKKTTTINSAVLDDTSESHLTKNEIIQILMEENPPVDGDNRFNQLFLIVEFKKINPRVGIIKGELYNNDQLDYRGSLLIPLMKNDTDQKNQWDSIEVGNSVYYGVSFDARELCMTEKIGEFLHRSIDEGKLQDFIPFIGSK
jgi:hypothetical protein